MVTPPEVCLGIVGVGVMGAAHARSILAGKAPGMRLAALCDPKPDAMETFTELPHFADPAAMLASGEVDAVLVATPHYDHTTIGMQVLEAGLHLLVEKPISVHKADCQRLIAAHHRPGQVFAAMFNQRGDPRYRKLKQLIDTGELGAITRINWIITDWYRTESYYAAGGWRATWAGEGGGVLLNQCPHQLDLWQWLFGMPTKVRGFCQLGRHHRIEVEDDVTAYFEYPDGCHGVFITTTGESPGTNRLEVACERGRVIVDDTGIHWTRNEVPTSQHCAEAKGGFEKPETWQIEIPFADRGPQHLGILQNFANAIRFGEALIAPAREGIHSVELANAILQSHEEGRTMALPLDAEAYAAFLRRRIETSSFVKETREIDLADGFERSF